jgi:hypothetical protein
VIRRQLRHHLERPAISCDSRVGDRPSVWETTDLFKRRTATSTWGSEIPGLGEFAATRSWQPRTDSPLSSRLADLVHRLSWILYDRHYATTLYDTTSLQHQTVFRDAYSGRVDDRGVVVANAWTNIGPQKLVKLYEMMGVGVCAVELSALSPIMLIQPRNLPPAVHYPGTPTMNAEFDDRFVVALSPAVDVGILTPELQRRIAAHEDWAFFGDENWLACASRGAFESVDDVSRRLDEVLGIVAAIPASVMPARVDHSVDDLATRIKGLSTIEDALAFLQQLTPEERGRLAQSDTPLALFADVSTPEAAMTRFESLDTQQRMQLLAIFQRVDGE